MFIDLETTVTPPQSRSPTPLANKSNSGGNSVESVSELATPKIAGIKTKTLAEVKRRSAARTSSVSSPTFASVAGQAGSAYDELVTIWEELIAEKDTVLGPHSKGVRTRATCLLGCQLVSFLMKNEYADTEVKSAQVGQRMLKHKFMMAFEDESTSHPFDENAWYIISTRLPPHPREVAGTSMYVSMARVRIQIAEERVVRYERYQSMIVMIAFFCAAAENEIMDLPINYWGNWYDEWRFAFIRNGSKAINSVASLLLCVMIWLYYRAHKRIRAMIDTYTRLGQDTVLLLPNRYFIYVELFMVCAHIPPLVEVHSSFPQFGSTAANTATYRWESIILMVMTLRVYIVLRWLRDRAGLQYKVYTPFFKGTGGKVHTLFILKHMMSDQPFLIFSGSIAMILGVAVYLLRVSELAMRQQHPENAEIWSNIWLVMATWSTVGYGDVVPFTHIGRLVLSLVMILGLMWGALMTAVLTRAIIFSSNEKRAVALVEAQAFTKKRQQTACNFIGLWYAKHHPSIETPDKMTWRNGARAWMKQMNQHIARTAAQTVEAKDATALQAVSRDNVALSGGAESPANAVSEALRQRLQRLENKMAHNQMHGNGNDHDHGHNHDHGHDHGRGVSTGAALLNFNKPTHSAGNVDDDRLRSIERAIADLASTMNRRLDAIDRKMDQAMRHGDIGGQVPNAVRGSVTSSPYLPDGSTYSSVAAGGNDSFSDVDDPIDQHSIRKVVRIIEERNDVSSRGIGASTIMPSQITIDQIADTVDDEIAPLIGVVNGNGGDGHSSSFEPVEPSHSSSPKKHSPEHIWVDLC